MDKKLEKLWEMADEELEQHEMARDDAQDTERSWYHDGWTDALKWLMNILEEELDEEADDEW